MNILRFRAWDKDEYCFINIKSFGFDEDGELWYLQSQDDNENDIDPPYFVEDLGYAWELMQYTNVIDKNGVTICEGDLIQVEGMRKPFKVWKRNDMVHIGNWNIQGFVNAFDFFEVVGNIYMSR